MSRSESADFHQGPDVILRPDTWQHSIQTSKEITCHRDAVHTWLFSGSPRGAKASATIYSLVETAKANGLNPYDYLLHVFEKLPYANCEDDLKALLPQGYVSKNDPA